MELLVVSTHEELRPSMISKDFFFEETSHWLFGYAEPLVEFKCDWIGGPHLL